MICYIFYYKKKIEIINQFKTGYKKIVDVHNSIYLAKLLNTTNPYNPKNLLAALENNSMVMDSFKKINLDKYLTDTDIDAMVNLTNLQNDFYKYFYNISDFEKHPFFRLFNDFIIYSR